MIPSAENAIQAFERIHRLHITVHDLRGNLMPQLSDSRMRHSHPLCRCVKAGGGESRCIAFEMLHLRRHAHELTRGRFHVCHAGLLEWVLPVYRGVELEWMLFAGVRRPAPSLVNAPREPLTRWEIPPWQPEVPMPEPVDDAEAADILEHLRQLSARLAELARDTTPGHNSAHQKRSSMDRASIIRRFIRMHAGRGELRLAELARELGVSPDRATHVIRQSCGRTYRELLLEARLETARELLRLSGLPVLEIALASGFQEVAHFNRLFRRETGQTPTEYRRSHAPVPEAGPHN